MEYEKLDYNLKWFEYGLLNDSILKMQLIEFDKGVDGNTEYYRYWTFLNYIHQKDEISDQEIDQFIELAKEDRVESMAGAAVKELYCSSILTGNQYDYLKRRLPEFGDWTLKVISRQDLLKELNERTINFELFLKCWEHKNRFKENLLIELILSKTDDVEILDFISTANISKKIKREALQKLEEILEK